MRFDYTTSPPPPPPGALSLKQQLLLTDPFGFELARKAMDDVLPTLSHVATSSIGATIGDYKPDAKMTRAELTKAYLATSHLEDQNSLGARWVQAAYTGVWRKACAELVRFFDSPELAGAGTRGYSGGQARSDWQAAEHDSPYDRNLFLYAMTEAAVALAILEDELSALGTWTDLWPRRAARAGAAGGLRSLRLPHAGHRLRQVPPDCELRPAAPAALAAFCARAKLRRGARALPRRRGPRDCVRQDALPRQPRARGAAGRPRAPEPALRRASRRATATRRSRSSCATPSGRRGSLRSSSSTRRRTTTSSGARSHATASVAATTASSTTHASTASRRGSTTGTTAPSLRPNGASSSQIAPPAGGSRRSGPKGSSASPTWIRRRASTSLATKKRTTSANPSPTWMPGNRCKAKAAERASVAERAQRVQAAAAAADQNVRTLPPFPPPPPRPPSPSPPPEKRPWYVPAGDRGEEDETDDYHRFSMRSLVIVTSSDDPRVAPGVHRLMDIPVFAEQPCKQVPYARCKRRDHPQLPHLVPHDERAVRGAHQQRHSVGAGRREAQTAGGASADCAGKEGAERTPVPGEAGGGGAGARSEDTPGHCQNSHPRGRRRGQLGGRQHCAGGRGFFQQPLWPSPQRLLVGDKPQPVPQPHLRGRGGVWRRLAQRD